MKDHHEGRKFSPLPALAVLVALLVLLVAGDFQIAHAATITVNTTNDELNSDGDCSLREAIQAANTDAIVDACTAGSGADTINLQAKSYTLSLPGVEDANATGDLDITDNLTIKGVGADMTSIDAAGIDRVLHIPFAFGVTVTISGLTITGGDALVGGGIYGGGIYVESSTATLELSRSTVSGNTADFGGGIYNRSILNVESSSVRENHANTGGGGIYGIGTAVTVDDSTVSGNTVDLFSGGGININAGTLDVNNSTISGNRAKFGGGIATSNNVIKPNLSNSTVFGNVGIGGGIRLGQNGTLTIENTIVAGNSGDGCEVGFDSTIVSEGHNLDSDGSCNLTESTDLPNTTNPQLGPLALNSPGSTETHALLAGSPAIDRGGLDCLPTDQRGVSRPQGAACDIGAYEVVAPTATSSAGKYCISGNSTGVGWTWDVKYFTPALTNYPGAVDPVLPPGAPPNDIAVAWVNSLNGPGLFLASMTPPDCFEISLTPAANSVLGPKGFFLSVNGCQITGTTGCTFNPTVVYVPPTPVGGTVTLSVTEDGSPFPGLPLASGAAAVIVALAAGGWYAMRRFARR